MSFPVDGWVSRTFRKYPWADFCLTCGCFVVTAPSHQVGLYKDHVVVRPDSGRPHG